MITEKIKKYIEKCREAMELANAIGNEICNALKDVMPNLGYFVGQQDGGIEAICFYDRDAEISAFDTEYYYLDELILEVFPELEGHICCSFGAWVNEEKARIVREKLKSLRQGNKGE